MNRRNFIISTLSTTTIAVSISGCLGDDSETSFYSGPEEKTNAESVIEDFWNNLETSDVNELEHPESIITLSEFPEENTEYTVNTIEQKNENLTEEELEKYIPIANIREKIALESNAIVYTDVEMEIQEDDEIYTVPNEYEWVVSNYNEEEWLIVIYMQV